jgi:hypothetical protein
MIFLGAALGGTQPYSSIRWIHPAPLIGTFASSFNGTVNTLMWPAANTTLTLNVTDAVGQSATATVAVNVLPAGTFTVDIQAFQTSFDRRGGIPAMMSADVIGGSGSLTYEWRNNDGVFAGVQNVSADVSTWSVGSHNVTVTVRDSLGNTATDSITITISELSVTVLPPDGTTAQNTQTLSFSATPSGGTPSYTCSWSSSIDGTLSPSCFFTISNLSIGSHTITVQVRDSGSPQLSATESITVNIVPLVPMAVAITSPSGGNNFTQGDNISFAGTVSGGIQPYPSFSWTYSGGTLASGNADFTDSSAMSFSSSALPVGSHAITLSVRDANGTTRTTSVSITVVPPPPLTASIASPGNNSTHEQFTDTISFQGSAVNGTGPYTYAWSSSLSGNLGNQQSFTRNDLASGIHVITLTVTDAAGNTDSDNVSISLTPSITVNAVKDMTKYTAKETFMIPHSNWRSVLQLVPVTTWNEAGTIQKYPALVYYQQSATAADADSTIHFMQLYGPTRVTTVGSINAAVGNLLVAATPTGAGLNAAQVNPIAAADYFSYWTLYDTVVIADYNNYEAGLVASLIASHYNVPLIMLSSANFASFQGNINGKKAVLVGPVDAALTAQIAGITPTQTALTIQAAQTLYVTKTGSRGLVVVNPNDLSFFLNENLPTEKNTGQVSAILSSISLTAPFLAASVKDVIGGVNLPNSGINNACSISNAITTNINSAKTAISSLRSSLFPAHPSRLTIIAQPQAIPDSRYTSCNSSGQQNRVAVDWQYGTDSSIFNTEPKAQAGRIYGLTLTDASSQIARTVFYDELIANKYSGSNTSLSIGHSSASACLSASRIRTNTSNAGFSSFCYTNCSNAGCTNSIRPAFLAPNSVYAFKKFISFADGGYFNSWTNTLWYSEIKFTQALDMPIVVADASNSNNLWQSAYINLMSIFILRHGAVSYIGSVSGTIPSTYTVADSIIASLGQNQDNTIGTAFYTLPTQAITPFNLLGFPGLKPNFPHINWN